MKPLLFSIISLISAVLPVSAGITFDTAAAPEHAAWAEKAKPVALEWVPRLSNLMAVPGSPPVPEISVTITPEYTGVAVTSGNRITIASEWVKKHPEDSVGALIHELVHVIQACPAGSEFWLVEGIADYFRFCVYEGKPPEFFDRPKKTGGYRDGYRVAAGFLQWLEAGDAPGIVRRLHAALRARSYSPDLFKTATGRSLDDLWDEYTREETRKLPRSPKRLTWTRNGEEGSITRVAETEWLEIQGGREHARFRETRRADTHIELHDEARGIRIKLTADGVWFLRDDQWVRLYVAKWVDEP